MIVYRCDISGRDLTSEQAQKCTVKKLGYAQMMGWQFNDTNFNTICDPSFYWHEEFDDKIDDYWMDRATVVQELARNWDARLQNHRKAFFKKTPKKVSAKPSHESEAVIRPS